MHALARPNSRARWTSATRLTRTFPSHALKGGISFLANVACPDVRDGGGLYHPPPLPPPTDGTSRRIPVRAMAFFRSLDPRRSRSTTVAMDPPNHGAAFCGCLRGRGGGSFSSLSFPP